MSIISFASKKSISDGFDYYDENRVLDAEQIDDTKYHGIVAGSNGERYDVTIDTERPRRSLCNCPHAYGRQIICKHKVALYFTIFPNEAEKYAFGIEKSYNKNYYAPNQMQDEIEYRIEQTVRKMKKTELQNALLDLLAECPDWQYERFVRTYLDLDEKY